MKVFFRTFTSGGMFSGPANVLKDASQQAADFASSLPPDSIINISQAFAQQNMAFATVWYRRGIGESATNRDANESEIQEWLDQPKAGS